MNNKIIIGLMSAALTLSAAHVQAHTNKTFLMPRPISVNLPMETQGFRELINRKAEDKFGGNIQATGFYKGSTGKKKLGKYFGIKEHDVVSFETTKDTLVKDFNLGYMIHDTTSATNSSANLGTIKFAPKHTEYGVRIDYFQELDKIVRGLYLKANFPVAHVENDMKLAVTLPTPRVSTDPITSREHIISYFKGNYDKDTTSVTQDSQVKLENALIDGKRSKTGIADIELVLGYKFVNKEKYNASLNLALVIPTGNEADGKYAFETLYGNGKHFAFGGGLDGMLRLWGDEHKNIPLNIGVNYRYLFEAAEKRTLGIKNYNWAQYTNLAAWDSTDTTHTKVKGNNIPAANKLTQNVDVTPGNMLDGIIDIGYNNGGFNITLGYNMYFRETESVKLKEAWTDLSYGIASPSGVGTTAYTSPKMISKSDFDTTAAETSSQFTNSIYGGMSYAFKEWEHPLMLGLGGSYEMVSKNSAIQGWSVWGKAGLSF